MGIPKLFKYLTERYPCLSQIFTANQLPEYDYFYIDLNNLIHKARSEKCSLPLEKVDEQFLSETRIFERVFRYIETLHRIVPSRVLFLAIDGVAPRAKWITQRERRFRVAENDDAIKSGFDSNAISPGTTFMSNLEEALIQFISNQIKCHSNWRNCEIYVSGSNCPGEGSLKIIDFIRSLKQSKSYKSNETHCIYSGDNDFLLLGFATHELYISLIQERKRCPSSLSMLCSDDIKHQFEVIHFEMLRQYLRMEFIGCKIEMSFEFNMDSIVDDWVLLMTLIGNDYVFGLPNFHLEFDALSVIYDAYKEVLKSSNGYINESGFLHVRRFARLIQSLRPNDFNLYCKNMQHSTSLMNKQLSSINLNNNNNDVEADAQENTEPTFSDFLDMKDQYYTDKLSDEKIPDFEQMSMNYVKTIQWVLFYYFRGTCSWSHSYPFACAPFISDFTTVHNVTFSLDIDKPDKPFTHLLAILPKSSAHLLPKSYQLMMTDDVQIDLENLTQKSYLAEINSNKDDQRRNTIKPVFKIRYDGSRSSDDCIQIIKIPTDKQMDRIDNGKHVQRPLHRDAFNFKFSSLNLLDYSSKLVKHTVSKPFPRITISLNVEQQTELDAVAKKYLNEFVYVNWPHFIEAKVIQVFDAKKKYDIVSGDINITENPAEFNACVDKLNTRYSEHGIELGEIKIVAFVAPLKWKEYVVSEKKSCAFELSKYCDEDNWQLVAVQTMVKSFMPEKWPEFKSVSEVLNVADVFLSSENSYHYGEMASICEAGNLKVNGRVNILSQMKQEPNFEKAIDAHNEAKANKITKFKQPSVAATILGISEKVLGRITGSVFISTEHSTDTSKRVNIGLQLKIRNVFQTSMNLLHDYVKTNGKQFLYSERAIDLIQKYMNKFPLVFELINSSDANILLVSDLERNQNNQSPLEYLAEIRNWLQSLPHSNATRTPVDMMQFSDDALKHVYDAIRDTELADGRILKLKMKWQNLYIPDLNSVFVVPSPDASYKLLDRIVVVRSGYPVQIGAKGTIIGIVPMHHHVVGNDITENDLFALDILMDVPFKIPSADGKFDEHFIYRTKSTNLLLNVSYGRANINYN